MNISDFHPTFIVTYNKLQVQIKTGDGDGYGGLTALYISAVKNGHFSYLHRYLFIYLKAGRYDTIQRYVTVTMHDSE